MIEIVRRLGGSIKVAGGDFGKYRGDERRSEPRIPASGTAHMQLLSPFDPTRIDVEIVDRSPSGLKIRTPREILRGTLIQLRLDHGLVLGEIRYCNAEDGRFVVGIQIQDQMGT